MWDFKSFQSACFSLFNFPFNVLSIVFNESKKRPTVDLISNELKKFTYSVTSLSPNLFLYVLKEYHGTHVANDLMQFAFKFAKERNYEKMYLSVWEYNFRARGFYEKLGFVNSGNENDFPLGCAHFHKIWSGMITMLKYT